MKRRAFVVGLGAVLAAPLGGETQQQAGKVWRIGYLATGFKDVADSNPDLARFTRSLRDLGYVDERNVSLCVRYAEGRAERFGALAVDLVPPTSSPLAPDEPERDKLCSERASPLSEGGARCRRSRSTRSNGSRRGSRV